MTWQPCRYRQNLKIKIRVNVRPILAALRALSHDLKTSPFILERFVGNLYTPDRLLDLLRMHSNGSKHLYIYLRDGRRIGALIAASRTPRVPATRRRR